MGGDEIRIQNARAAAAYDVLPYEAPHDPVLDVERVCTPSEPMRQNWGFS